MLLSPLRATTTQLLRGQLLPFTATRPLSTTMAGASRFQFSAGSDEAALTTAVAPLLSDSDTGGRWILTKDGAAIERSFRFKTFAKTWVGLLRPFTN
jgi:hypothetical protein